MARKSLKRVRVSAQSKSVSQNNLSKGAQAKVSSNQMRKKLLERKSQSDEDTAAQTIFVPSPGSQGRNQTLLERGVSVVRPEIIAATEFIPLVKDDNSEDATFTMTTGDKEYRIDITNASRLMEMQLISQRMLMRNVEIVLESYAAENLSYITSAALKYLNSSNAKKINLISFNAMKRQVKDQLENANVEAPSPLFVTDNPGTVGAMALHSKKLKKRKARFDRESARAKFLANKFKSMDPKYANLLIEYITRKMIVNYTNDFLSEMAKIKTRTKKLFEIYNINNQLMENVIESNPKIREIVAQLKAGTINPTKSFKFSMQDFMRASLKLRPLDAYGSTSSSLNIMTVLKSLSAEIQVRDRGITFNQGRAALLKQRVPKAALPKPQNPTNGSAEYETFNIASYFGGPNRSWNMVMNGGGGENFSNNAYKRVRDILRSNNNFHNKLLNTEESLNYNKIESAVIPLLSKVFLDLTMHNNLITKGMTGFKVPTLSNSTNKILTRNERNLFSAESYCKVALFNGSLSGTQSVSKMITKSDQTKSYFVKTVMDARLLPGSKKNVVLPTERLSAKINLDGRNYIPGSDFFFDDGLGELVSSDRSEVTFSQMSNYADNYDKAISDILEDFKTMRGLDDESVKFEDGIEQDDIQTISADYLADSLNNAIADYLDDHLNVANPEFSSLFFLLIARMASKDDYYFSAFMTLMQLKEYQQWSFSEAGFKANNRHGAFHNAFDISSKPGGSGGDDKRQKTFGVGKNGKERDYYMDDVSIMKYCFSHMFLELHNDVFNQPKTGDTNREVLGDDFYINIGQLPTVKKTLKKNLIEDEPEGTWGVIEATHDDYFKKPFEHFYENAYVGHTGGIGDYFYKLLYFTARNVSDKTNTSLKNKIDIPGTGKQARQAMVTNGGDGFLQPNITDEQFQNRIMDGKLALNTNKERTYLGLNSTAELRNFAVWSYALSIFAKCGIVRVVVEEGEKSLTLKTYRKAIRAAIAALRGRSFNSERHSRVVYNNITRITRGLRQEIKDNNKSCFEHFLVLKTQAAAIKDQIQNIDSFIKGQASGNDYRHALRYYEQSGMGKNLLSFLSPSMVASNKFSELKLMTPSRSSGGRIFPSCDVIGSKRMREMIMFFSQKNKGYHMQEKIPVLNGRKTTMHIGIPAGMLENLQFEAIRNTGDETYDGSNIVMVTIYRKDVLNTTSYVYPKTFAFDMSRFVLEDIPSAIPRRQTFLNPEDLIKQSRVYKINGFGQVVGQGIGRAYDSKKQNFENPAKYSDDFLNSIFMNHLTNYYLKMYYKLMLGLDFNEYVFQLTPDSAIKNGPDGSNQDLLNTINDTNLILFPEASENLQTANELNKLSVGISNSLYFNSERYMKACIYPNMFDRVFSVMINERDFILASGDPEADKRARLYGGIVTPQFKTSPGVEAIANIRIPLSKMTPNQKYYNSARNKDYPQIYMYYAEISLMKRIEVPEY